MIDDLLDDGRVLAEIGDRAARLLVEFVNVGQPVGEPGVGQARGFLRA